MFNEQFPLLCIVTANLAKKMKERKQTNKQIRKLKILNIYFLFSLNKISRKKNIYLNTSSSKLFLLCSNRLNNCQ